MPSAKTDVLDAAIVGGGPAGLSAGLLLARCCRRIAVIDAGQPRNRVARELHGFLGRDCTPPGDLNAAGRRELRRYGVDVLEDVVVRACPDAPADPRHKTAFAIETAKGRSFTSRKLLVATGMADELPAVEGMTACYGISVHHCPYCDGFEHRGKHLIAFGEQAKDAVGLGLALAGWSRHVTVITHGDRVDEDDRQRLDALGIGVKAQRVARLVHDGGRLRALELEPGESIAADALFFNTGQHGASDLARSLGCVFDADDTAQTGRRQTSGVPGLFLAGDVDGDVQFAIVAAAEGATAAVAINRELQEEDRPSQ